MEQFTIGRELKVGSGETLQATQVMEATGAIQFTEIVPEEATVIIATYIPQPEMLWMSSDRDIQVTLDDGVDPTYSGQIKANVPFLWSRHCGLTFPASESNIINVSLQNSSGAEATFKLRALFDAVP